MKKDSAERKEKDTVVSRSSPTAEESTIPFIDEPEKPERDGMPKEKSVETEKLIEENLLTEEMAECIKSLDTYMESIKRNIQSMFAMAEPFLSSEDGSEPETVIEIKTCQENRHSSLDRIEIDEVQPGTSTPQESSQEFTAFELQENSEENTKRISFKEMCRDLFGWRLIVCTVITIVYILAGLGMLLYAIIFVLMPYIANGL